MTWSYRSNNSVQGAIMDYMLREKFRVTAFFQFGKAVASFESLSFPNDHDIINFLLDNPGCEAKVEKIYTTEMMPF
jgi:hypothetical protein